MPVALILNGSIPPVLSDGNEVCLEEGRINSFDANWPHSDDSPCSRERMAKAGFFFRGGHSDQVMCFVCHIKLSDWDPEQDDPWQKHRELSRNCLFASIGKEEDSLTVEQWCDVICNRTINIWDGKFNKLQEALDASN